jgi:hypothetical protein
MTSPLFTLLTTWPALCASQGKAPWAKKFKSEEKVRTFRGWSDGHAGETIGSYLRGQPGCSHLIITSIITSIT